MTGPSGPQVDQRLRAAVEAAPSGLLMTDSAGRIVLVNREIERQFGYSREELLGHQVELLVPDSARRHHEAFRAGFVANPQVRAMGAGRDLYGKRKDGTAVPVEIGLTPVITPEGMFVLATIVDITARKQAESGRQHLEEQLRQAQKMEAIGTLAGGIAHDFNNVLGAIVGYGEMILAASRKLPEIAADANELLASAQRGRQLVERILTFSRRQTGVRRPLDLRKSVHAVHQLLRASIPATVEVNFQIPDAPHRVSADETAVHQVLMNLSMNSAQAMPEGGTLSISLEELYVRDSMARSNPGLREGPYVLLKVRDTGAGIDPAHRSRVFEPFFTTKPVGEGTGLGLAMVHAIMQDHDGVVALESEVGQGTEIRCFFPLLETEAAATEAAHAARTQGKGENILFLDDEPSLARIGARRLIMLNYRVAEFTDPRQALAHFTQHSEDIDLVVTDFTMPHMTGLDLARTLYQVRPNVRIILLTGFVDDMDEQRLRDSGICRVLRKPVTMDELSQAVREVLEAR